MCPDCVCFLSKCWAEAFLLCPSGPLTLTSGRPGQHLAEPSPAQLWKSRVGSELRTQWDWVTGTHMLVPLTQGRQREGLELRAKERPGGTGSGSKGSRRLRALTSCPSFKARGRVANGRNTGPEKRPSSVPLRPHSFVPVLTCKMELLSQPLWDVVKINCVKFSCKLHGAFQKHKELLISIVN